MSIRQTNWRSWPLEFMQMTVQQVLDRAQAQLGGADDARTDAQWLLMHVLQCSRTHLISHAGQVLTSAQWQDMQDCIARRQAGEPVAYITGSRGFWTLDLQVTPAVLIPRPDTELLVEQVLLAADASTALTVADLGTGSGAIALAIASERPRWRVLATDISEDALAVARLNAETCGLTTVEFYAGFWCQALPDAVRVDILVSNPPYIEPGDPHLTQGDLRFEPLSALSSEDNGLRDLKVISSQAAARLNPGGWLMLEHGYNQGAAVRRMLTAGGFGAVATQRDINGHERVTVGQLRLTPGAMEVPDNRY